MVNPIKNMHIEPTNENGLLLNIVCWILVFVSYLTKDNMQMLALGLACAASISTILLNCIKYFRERKK